MPTVLVVIPTYNEAENIGTLLRAVFATQGRLKRYNLQVLVVDDSSPDGTGDLVAAWAKDNAKLHLLTGQKAGLGNAYLRGFQFAIRKFNPYVVVMMDADMSHDPAAIPSLLEAVESGADYVIGSRYVHGGTIPGNWPLRRIVNSRVANFLARTLVGVSDEISDLTGGYKAMRGAVLKRVLKRNVMASGYVFQVSLLHAFRFENAQVVEIPIKFVDRQFGTSKMRLRDILEFIYRAYQLNKQSPLRRGLRFLLVGASGVLVNLLVATVLIQLNVSAFAAVAIAIELSIVSNFVLHERFTFAADGLAEGAHKRLAQFNLTALVGAGISYLIFTILYTLGWHYALADLAAIVCSTAWSWYASVNFVWSKRWLRN